MCLHDRAGGGEYRRRMGKGHSSLKEMNEFEIRR
jgi:hypothetical protein